MFFDFIINYHINNIADNDGDIHTNLIRELYPNKYKKEYYQMFQ